MPFTQAFDQFFTIVVVLGISIYLLRTVCGVALLVVGRLPSKLGASARAAGQRITPRLVMKIITTATGLLVAATGIGATTALAAPTSVSSNSASAQSGDADYYNFDDLEDLLAIDRGPSIDEYDDYLDFDEADISADTGTREDSAVKSQDDTDSKDQQEPNTSSSTQHAPSKESGLEAGSPHANKQPSNTPADTANDKKQRKPQADTSTKQRPSKSNSGQTQAKQGVVVVKHGDTLWSIAAQRLDSKASDAKIDREWRRWYQANVDVIGSDPDIIIPGMKLEAPKS